MNESFGSEIPRSLEWFERARRVIPSGIYGHTSPASALPGVFPYFAGQASGARYHDVDAREFLDFLCGYGTCVLGAGDPVVEAAAEAQRKRGNVFNHPAPVAVELAEALVGRIDFADWVVFGKNGSDMTTWAVQVAREYTARPKIFKVAGAYHGVDAWATPGQGGLIAEDRVHVHEFAWNRLDTIDLLLKQHSGKVAALVLTPFHHPAYAASELPEPGFWKGIEERCRRNGILIILDDIRAGFRLDGGGSHRVFGFQPDLACYCKALANGYPLSAAVGREELRKAASKVFLTGSYWNNAVPMAAAHACLGEMDKRRIPERLEQLGAQLCAGLERAGKEAGVPLKMTGPPAMPYPVFADDPHLYRVAEFCGGAVRRGVLFHPYHNWFLSGAHTEEDIDQAITVASETLTEMKENASAASAPREE